MGPKSYFGTLCFFSNVNSLCTVETVTHVKILYITEEIFWKAASQFPGVSQQFKTISENFDLLTEFQQISIRGSLQNPELDDDLWLSDGIFLLILVSIIR